MRPLLVPSPAVATKLHRSTLQGQRGANLKRTQDRKQNDERVVDVPRALFVEYLVACVCVGACEQSIIHTHTHIYKRARAPHKLRASRNHHSRIRFAFIGSTQSSPSSSSVLCVGTTQNIHTHTRKHRKGERLSATHKNRNHPRKSCSNCREFHIGFACVRAFLGCCGHSAADSSPVRYGLSSVLASSPTLLRRHGRSALTHTLTLTTAHRIAAAVSAIRPSISTSLSSASSTAVADNTESIGHCRRRSEAAAAAT